jgi:hypothetical protein
VPRSEAICPSVSIRPRTREGDLAKELRSQHPQIRILYRSGFSDRVLTDRGDLGEDDPFIRKPFGNDPLLERVREVLDARLRQLIWRPAEALIVPAGLQTWRAFRRLRVGACLAPPGIAGRRPEDGRSRSAPVPRARPTSREA